MGFTTYEAHAEYTSMNVTQSLEASGVIALGMLRRMSALDPDFEYFSVPVPISFEIEVREISSINYLGLQPVAQTLPIHTTVNILMKRAIQSQPRPTTEERSPFLFQALHEATEEAQNALRNIPRPVPRSVHIPPLNLPQDATNHRLPPLQNPISRSLAISENGEDLGSIYGSSEEEA